MKYFTIILFLLSCYVANAQKQGIYPEVRTVLIQSVHTLVEAAILVKKDVNVKTKPNCMYYWYAFNQIKCNQGAFSGNLLHGSYKVYNNDRLVLQGQFENGIKQGLWIAWDNNGYKCNEINYKDGERNGMSSYYKDNKLFKEEEYDKGILDGEVTLYAKDGSLEKMNYEEGVLVPEDEKVKESFFNRWKDRRDAKKEERELKEDSKEDKPITN